MSICCWLTLLLTKKNIGLNNHGTTTMDIMKNLHMVLDLYKNVLIDVDMK